MGDLVLTEAEVNPVMSAVLDNGLDVTALHNHFFFDTPRIFYMHVHGHGTPADLAKKIQPALALIGKSPQPPGVRRARDRGHARHRRAREDRSARPASRTARSTRSRSAGPTSR